MLNQPNSYKYQTLEVSLRGQKAILLETPSQLLAKLQKAIGGIIEIRRLWESDKPIILHNHYVTNHYVTVFVYDLDVFERSGVSIGWGNGPTHKEHPLRSDAISMDGLHGFVSAAVRRIYSLSVAVNCAPDESSCYFHPTSNQDMRAAIFAAAIGDISPDELFFKVCRNKMVMYLDGIAYEVSFARRSLADLEWLVTATSLRFDGSTDPSRSARRYAETFGADLDEEYLLQWFTTLYLETTEGGDVRSTTPTNP